VLLTKCSFGQDNPLNQRIVQQILNKIGFSQVEIAQNGKAVLDLIERNGPESYAVLLLDIEMPELGSWVAGKLFNMVVLIYNFER
jgi:CheY-like chemotaxis protein